MSHSIDDRTGTKLGLTGQYADTPAFQIVNDTHNLFLALTSRLIGLEYGRFGNILKNHPLWPAIDKDRSSLAEHLSALGGDAILAIKLTKEIRLLEEKANDLVTAVSSERTA